MMIRLALAAALTLAALAAPAAARAGTCEEDVVAYCVATTCPDYCKAGPKADRSACTATCTADDRCKLTLFGGQDRKDQVELDIQKREQLMSCLAENRGKVKVPDDLGAPIVEEDPEAAAIAKAVAEGADAAAVKKAAEQARKAKKKPKKAAAAKPGSVADRAAKKATWKKRQTSAFTARRKGKPRVDPVEPAP